MHSTESKMLNSLYYNAKSTLCNDIIYNMIIILK